MDNPLRERGTHKVLEDVFQVQINYNKVFGNHTVTLLLNERIHRRDLDTWVHAVPNTNVLPLSTLLIWIPIMIVM